MEDVGAQVVPPIFLHQTLSGRFCEVPPMGRKRDLSYQNPSFLLHHHQEQQRRPEHPQRFDSGRDNWNPRLWDWDSVNFVGKTVEPPESLRLGNCTTPPEQRRRNKEDFKETDPILTLKKMDEDDESLRLNLGVSGITTSVPEPVSRPNKRVRSGSPGNNGNGNGNHPMCQVDNCKKDLSIAKDYHRRHKVCEVHSKTTEALVGKQMQRFCQQCSRFHPLSEFDEGKRSCRRRLAGHNRRRRKTQPEDVVNSQLLLPANRENNNVNNNNGNLDLVNLLAAVARAQGKNEAATVNSSSSLPDKDQLIQILSKINSIQFPTDLSPMLQYIGNLSQKNLEQHPSSSYYPQKDLNSKTPSPSTKDLLAALSATVVAAASSSSPDDALAFLSQRHNHNNNIEKTELTCPNLAGNLQKRPPCFLPVGGERSSSSYQSPPEDSGSHSGSQVQETRSNVPLQLFSSSPENDSPPPKLDSSRKYFSSDSSNPMEVERSPSSSPPVVQKFFPLQIATESSRSKKNQGFVPLELFNQSNAAGGGDNGSIQSFPYQTGYTSSSGSGHSPSTLSSDPQERTGRIMFKLFDKDPSHFPVTLRKQIFNWLYNCPSEMESYIRPGCVILSVYVSMSSSAWQQFEGNFLRQVNGLTRDSEFWGNARFLVHAGRQLASHKDGKIRLCKSWKTWSSPELISVSPLAIVSGQETNLLLRGRNLTKTGTKIHCTNLGACVSMEVTGSTYQGTFYEEISVGSLKIVGSDHPSVSGRFFIEVENGFKGNSFPVIIADATICKELSLLESEFDVDPKLRHAVSEQHNLNHRPEETLHFLNELGWLFQRKTPYSLNRFKFLLVFCVERDWCALMKTVLDVLVERHIVTDGLSEECREVLAEAQLLSRAVKRRCRKMVDFLIKYSVNIYVESSREYYVFPPNVVGPGGITPLHLAACISGSDDMVDALTNDPRKIGLTSWSSHLDTNGQSPYSYATMRNNHSYNQLVARKLADATTGQVSVTIDHDIMQSSSTSTVLQKRAVRFNKSCAQCAMVATKYNKRISRSQGLLQRPYVHSMLAIAAVCVCVCLFLRGSPDIGLVAPFKWENLDFGTK